MKPDFTVELGISEGCASRPVLLPKSRAAYSCIVVKGMAIQGSCKDIDFAAQPTNHSRGGCQSSTVITFGDTTLVLPVLPRISRVSLGAIIEL